jgi:hypothetical protein
MRRQKARKHFLGQDGHAKLNCGQAVIKAYHDVFDAPAAEVDLFAGYGGGKAPEGRCGAYHAAHHLLSKKAPHKVQECQQEFREAAGALTCKDIRQGRKLSCLGCVEKAAEILSKHHGS